MGPSSGKVTEVSTTITAESPVQIATASIKADQQLSNTRLDPSKDGWETEVVAEQAKKILLKLCGDLANRESIEVPEKYVSSEITCGQLRPADLAPVKSKGSDGKEITVHRAANTKPESPELQGRESLEESLRNLAIPFADASDVHVHVKIVQVHTGASSVKTVAYFEAGGRSETGSVQQRATWHCTWVRNGEKSIQLTSIRATDFEEVHVAGPWLVDCTRAVLQENHSFNEQLVYGHHHWLTRLSRAYGNNVFMRIGMAMGDVNGDGRDDIYVCQQGGLPNRLFIQQADGTAVDRSHESGVDWLDHTSSALIVDLDNDGDQDLIAATSAGLLVMENDGSANYQLRNTLATGNTDMQSFTAVDYDQDGDLDLYICIEFVALSSANREEFVFTNANDGAPNLLFRNDMGADGQWQFTNVTKEVGLDADNRRHSLSCAWEDYDNDGDQDLYVANDFGQNCLYRNDGGQFTNIAAQAGVVDSNTGMSVSWGDFNRDGWMDIYVANMFSSAGSRITQQKQFMPSADSETKNLVTKFAKGNTLLQNDGQGKFLDVSKEAGVEMGRWAWSSLFADLNNDAWDDLVVANGYISTEDTGDL